MTRRKTKLERFWEELQLAKKELEEIGIRDSPAIGEAKKAHDGARAKCTAALKARVAHTQSLLESLGWDNYEVTRRRIAEWAGLPITMGFSSVAEARERLVKKILAQDPEYTRLNVVAVKLAGTVEQTRSELDRARAPLVAAQRKVIDLEYMVNLEKEKRAAGAKRRKRKKEAANAAADAKAVGRSQYTEGIRKLSQDLDQFPLPRYVDGRWILPE